MQDIENEVESLNCEVKMAEKQKAISFLSMLKAPFRWPMLLSIMVILSQQLTGVNAAYFHFLGLQDFYFPRPKY